MVLRFVKWRKMTWVFFAWNAAMLVWTLASGFSAVILLWAVGVVALALVWWSTRPLWRQGHGARLHRVRAEEFLRSAP